MSTEISGPGCSVTVLGRAGLRYREGDRTIFVDGKMLTGEFDFVVYASSISAWESSGERIAEAERKRIISNIEAAFRQNGMRVDVER
jgi:hypothetical protein